MGKWTKYFIDGAMYEGSDEAISLKQASWRNSRNEGISKVILEHKPYRISIEGLGEYWQSDTYNVFLMENGSSTVTKRRIQRKFNNDDKFMEVIKDRSKYDIKVLTEQPSDFRQNDDHYALFPLPDYRVQDTWLTVEVDLTKRLLRHFFHPRKI